MQAIFSAATVESDCICIEAKKFYKTAEHEKVQIEKRICELDNIVRCLYEDRVTGRISPERYDAMASGYEQEQSDKKQALQDLAERISKIDMREKCIQEFIDKAKAYIEMPKLTSELLRVFVRRIEVYEKAEKCFFVKETHSGTISLAQRGLIP